MVRRRVRCLGPWRLQIGRIGLMAKAGVHTCECRDRLQQQDERQTAGRRAHAKSHRRLTITRPWNAAFHFPLVGLAARTRKPLADAVKRLQLSIWSQFDIRLNPAAHRQFVSTLLGRARDMAASEKQHVAIATNQSLFGGIQFPHAGGRLSVYGRSANELQFEFLPMA